MSRFLHLFLVRWKCFLDKFGETSYKFLQLFLTIFYNSYNKFIITPHFFLRQNEGFLENVFLFQTSNSYSLMKIIKIAELFLAGFTVQPQVSTSNLTWLSFYKISENDVYNFATVSKYIVVFYTKKNHESAKEIIFLSCFHWFYYFQCSQIEVNEIYNRNHNLNFYE